MHGKSTLLLVLLAAGAGAWYFKGDDWAVRLGLRPAPVAAGSPSLAVLADALTPGAITRVEVPAASGDPLVIEKAGAGWKLPGNWPLRGPEAEELVGLLANLRTRFQPVPVEPGADLTPFGLAPGQKPLTVTVTAGDKAHTLTFGEPPASVGEPPFTRPAYLRVDAEPEVLRLGPDVLPVLRRPADGYRRRQLVPDGERVKVAASAAASPFAPSVGPAGGVSTVVLLGDTVTEVSARGPGKTVRLFGASVPVPEAYTLRRVGPRPPSAAAEKGGEPAVSPDRLADAWELAAPARDRVDPEKLQKILAAVPDLWVEEFVSNPDKPTGLDKPERTLTIARATGGPVTLQIGAVARTSTRDEAAPAPNIPGLPPMPSMRKVTEEYRYAKLADNPQLFLVKADRFADLFAGPKELRDARLARFSPDEVDEVVVTAPGRGPVRLTRVKGDPKAADFADRADRWRLDRGGEAIPAETSLVTELLTQLSGLRAADADPKAAVPGPATTVTVVARDKRPDGDPPAPARTYTLLVGKPEPDAVAVTAAAASGPLAALAALGAGPTGLVMQVGGWPRVVRVEDAAVGKALDRPAVAYRSKRLFDPPGRLDAVTVGTGEKAFTLARDDAGWKLTAPFAAATDAGEIGKLTGPLGGLEAAEWVDDDPAKAGLDPPRQTVALTLGGKPYTLRIGGPRDGKPEAYARLDGGPVFTLPATTADPLVSATPLDVLDKTLAAAPAVDQLTLTRDGRSFTFAKTDGVWRVTAPKPGPADADLDQLVASLAKLRADKLVALKPTPEQLTAFGLDPPAATWVAAAGGKDVATLLVGAKDASGKVYARVGDTVGLLPPEASARVLGEYRDRAVWTLDEAAVEAVEVRRGGAGFKLVRKGAGWEDAADPAAAVDPKAASELLTALGGLRAERFAGDGPDDLTRAGLGVPSGVVTLTLRGGGSRTLVLGGPVPGTDGTPRFARVAGPDGGEAFALSAADTRTLTRPRSAYDGKKGESP